MHLKRIANAALGLSLVSVWTAWQHDLVAQAQKVQIPIFEYDSTFPKPLPENWAFGQQGVFGGSLNVPHAIAVDSRGNIYVGENFDARRFQRFLYKGLGTPVPGANPPTTVVR